MRKYILFLFLILSAFVSNAQKVTKIDLVKSDSFIGLKRNGESTNKVINPIFKQDNATLTCDSAYFYIQRNGFEAFGHVHINQADTVNIYSDHLNYDGNTKLAILKNNVKLTDNQAVLTTNDLDYNLGTKLGRYYNGGKIVNDKNTLTSQNGFYYTESKDAFFRYNVVVKSPEVLIKSDTLKYNTLSKIAYFFGPTHIYGKTDTLYTENGLYNTTNDQAAFGKNNLYTQNSKSLKGDSLYYDGKKGFGRAQKHIIFKDTAQKVELRGDLGIYHRIDESIVVTKNAYVILTTEKDSVKKDSIWMTADTLRSRVVSKSQLYDLQHFKLLFKDSKVSKLVLKPRKPEQQDSSGRMPIAKDSLQNDSLKLNAVPPKIVLKDSIKTKPVLEKLDTIPGPIRVGLVNTAPRDKLQIPKLQVQDSNALNVAAIYPKKKTIKIVLDTLPSDATDTTKIRIVSAYKNVKIFKSDLQGKADSAFFSYGDSVLRIYQKPIIWAEGSQLSADTMYLQMKNKRIDNVDLIRNAIVVNTEKDSAKYNQVAGKFMKGYFKNDKLDVIYVNGNAESIYFPSDSSGENGMMRSIAARMRINFRNDSLMDIAFIRKPEHHYYPVDKITEELRTLPNFNWKPKERPKSKEDIISNLKVLPKAGPKDKPKKKLEIKDKVKQAKPALEPKKAH